MATDDALLLRHSQAAQMLESCRNWLDPGLGLIKLANPAAGTGFQGQNWRGHKLEVSRTLLGGARAWHNSDGEMVCKVQRRGRMSRPQLHSGKVKNETASAKAWECGWSSRRAGSDARQMIASNPHPHPLTSFSSWTSVREACWMSSCTGAFCFLPACSARWP